MASCKVSFLSNTVPIWYCTGAEQLLRGLEFDRCRLLAYAQPLDNRR